MTYRSKGLYFDGQATIDPYLVRLEVPRLTGFYELFSSGCQKRTPLYAKFSKEEM